MIDLGSICPKSSKRRLRRKSSFVDTIMGGPAGVDLDMFYCSWFWWISYSDSDDNCHEVHEIYNGQ